MKNSNDKIGNQTHDLPACSKGSQRTAPPHSPSIKIGQCSIKNFNPQNVNYVDTSCKQRTLNEKLLDKIKAVYLSVQMSSSQTVELVVHLVQYLYNLLQLSQRIQEQ